MHHYSLRLYNGTFGRLEGVEPELYATEERMKEDVLKRTERKKRDVAVRALCLSVRLSVFDRAAFRRA